MDNVRASEDFGGDNHIYMYYDSREIFEVFLQAVDITPYLPSEKFIFDMPKVYADAESGTHLYEADTVIYAVGQRPLMAESEALRECAPEYYAIGDCIVPKDIWTATTNAYYIARDLGRY